MLATRKLPSSSRAKPLGAPFMLPTSACPPSGSMRVRAARLSDTQSVQSGSATMHSGRERSFPMQRKSCGASLKPAIGTAGLLDGDASLSTIRQSRRVLKEENRMPAFLRYALAVVLAAAPFAAGAQQRPLSLTHLTAPAGIGEYEWGLSIDRIFARHSKWLRQRSQPTQGYLYNLRYTLENPGTWGTLVVNMDPVSPWLASKKQPPFE